MEQLTDIFIIGGGINGAAIAADAAGRGLSVVLCEKNDLAAGTSSASTKLIHGGLRYLENYDFKMVHHALQEREILMRRASNLVRPLEFILPHESHSRPYWFIRLGLFIYDHLAKSTLAKSKSINFKNALSGKPLLKRLTKGFSYFDCATDDARLVIENALLAKQHGALILSRTELIAAHRENSHWKIQLKNTRTNEIYFRYAKTLINAAGPWVQQVQQKIASKTLSFTIELVKGSHIIVPKLYEGDFAYLLQNQDNRVVFVIPYQTDFSLIGTTDIAFTQDLNQVSISAEEKNYLCEIINRYFKKSIQPSDIVWSYAGVRCLQNTDASNLSKITRDYKLLLDTEENLPLITVIGGKLTTHRILAEEAIDKLSPYFPHMKASWTAESYLPGSYFASQNFAAFYAQFKIQYHWLPEKLAHRYAQIYGTRALELLGNATSLADLGKEYAAELYQREVDYLIQYEWAENAEDILWRRTKLGLRFSDENRKKLTESMPFSLTQPSPTL